MDRCHRIVTIMHFVLTPHGTAGDVFPSLAIGRGLKERGHRVTVITPTYTRDLMRRFGLDFIDLDDEPGYSFWLEHPDRWNPLRGMTREAVSIVQRTMRRYYYEIERLYVPGETVVITSCNGVGVRIAHEKLGVPMVSAHIAPWLIRSISRPHQEAIGGALVRRLPVPALRAGIFWIADRWFADPAVRPEVDRFRAELGLRPQTRLYHRWIHSPQCVIGLFPPWLVDPLPEDWPPVKCTGFPFFDAGDGGMPKELEVFLDAGEPPLVFSPGSTVPHVRFFYEAAVEACVRLKRRGLLLTRYPELVPQKLPEAVRHFAFVPHSLVMPRAAALISHGGAGTIAQGLRAGIPQVIMPITFDQPDNAFRLAKLGVARTLPPRRFNAETLTRALAALLKCDDTRRKCKALAASLVSDDPVKETCDQLEEFADRVASRAEARPVRRQQIEAAGRAHKISQ
jgi:UDP:flavonoid glycosyltransferase YjiC (YdhE family)